jgi:hypothetical protein
METCCRLCGSCLPYYVCVRTVQCVTVCDIVVILFSLIVLLYMQVVYLCYCKVAIICEMPSSSESPKSSLAICMHLESIDLIFLGIFLTRR